MTTKEIIKIYTEEAYGVSRFRFKGIPPNIVRLLCSVRLPPDEYIKERYVRRVLKMLPSDYDEMKVLDIVPEAQMRAMGITYWYITFSDLSKIRCELRGGGKSRNKWR